MNLAAIDWLSISIDLLLVVFVIVCLLMILLVLMQRPKQEGLGAAFGAGVTDQVFGARTTNVLQRGTVYLASLFFLLSLVLAVLIGHKNQKISLLKSKNPPAKEASAQPDKPKEEPPKPKSLSEELPADQREPTTPPVSEPTTPPVSEPATPPVSEPAMPPVSEPTTPPVSEPATPPVSEPASTPTTPAADPVPATPARKTGTAPKKPVRR